jgi:hypothetical protein
MNADRLTVWIYKIVPGGVRLQLVHEQALTGGITIASWSRDEVDDARENPIPGHSIAEQLNDAATEHCENLGESCRYLIQWVGAQAQPLRTMIHRVAPAEAASGVINVHAMQAGNVSGNQLTAQLLSHIAQQQKVINGSIGVILTAYERAMTMQQQMIQQLGARIDALPPPAAENEEFSKAKIRALDRLSELGPDIGRLFLGAIERAITGGDVGDAVPPTDRPSNGVVS